MLVRSLPIIAALCTVAGPALKAAPTMLSAADGVSLRPVPERLRLEPPWTHGSKCGPNSLFVLLRLRGVDVSLEAVTSHFKAVDSRGCSLHDLQTSAADCGMQSDVSFISARDLSRVQPPFIAHLAHSDRQPHGGHFLTVFEYRSSEDDFGIIDGTSGVHSYIAADSLHRSFSGYVLVPQNRTVAHLRRLSLWCITAAMVAILVAVLSQRASRRLIPVSSRVPVSTGSVP